MRPLPAPEVGQQFGRWTVLESGLRDEKNWHACECRCTCGTVATVRNVALIRGTSKSCGCLSRDRAAELCHSRRKADIQIGTRFDRLTAIALDRVPATAPSLVGKTTAVVTCRCDCGTLVAVRAPDLRSGNTRSCGCLHGEVTASRNYVHGLRKHPLYGTWKSMNQRCFEPNSGSYKHYGGRGITVYPEWRDATVFIAWIEANIGPRPPHMSLDRIDPDGNYEPGNVQWATYAEQCANRRKCAWLGVGHWRVILAALAESTSPEAPGTYAALSLQMKGIARTRYLGAGVLSGDPLLFGGENDEVREHYRRLVAEALADLEESA